MSLLLRQKLPDFPWDALAPYGEIARTHPQGAIDLSVGTPVDPTPEFIQQALRESANSPSYPVTMATQELRTAINTFIGLDVKHAGSVINAIDGALFAA